MSLLSWMARALQAGSCFLRLWALPEICHRAKHRVLAHQKRTHLLGLGVTFHLFWILTFLIE